MTTEPTMADRLIGMPVPIVSSVAQAAPAFSNEILENVRRDLTASLNLLSSRTSNKERKNKVDPFGNEMPTAGGDLWTRPFR